MTRTAPAWGGPHREPDPAGGIPAWGAPYPPHPVTRLRPPVRAAAIAACLVLGFGLLGGAAAGSWLTGGGDETPAAGEAFHAARDLWHSIPVDQLFPRTVRGDDAGPGGADRTWTRIAVAPDATCKRAFDPLLAKALSPVGCKRLLRASYVDATTSSVTTVGLVITKADASGMRALRERFASEKLGERSDLMPCPYAAKGTAAARFGDAQRATWVVRVLTDVPAVTFAVTGFADGRKVSDPQPVSEAAAQGTTSAPGQAGLGYDADGLADRIERDFRTASTAAAAEEPS
ncbi:hypothetical protein [Streptomyces sp. NPDC051776]|uniref:hypothetical protein n=1 Tax=Streptomyces sp. NPDC051776 TaxID=3155414 RepID=UPI0034274397